MTQPTDAMFADSMKGYETWLRAQLGADFVEADLAVKHDKMRKDAFAFLRATYWRWAETILTTVPEFAGAPQVLAIGDTHLENFGTWRDIEGRLVWGANDFDEAAVMPYPLDIIRLAASALLARGASAPSVAAICDPILDGYGKGLAEPRPYVLEARHRWLREAVVLSEKEREKYWDKFAPPTTEETVPPPAGSKYVAVLASALPLSPEQPTIMRRTAGTGSLGRPRFVARLEWNGGPVLREAKALVTSAWSLHHDKGASPILAGTIASGRYRAPDPHYRVVDGIAVRRLSPSSRKIEVKDAVGELLAPAMLEAMGREIANCHAGDDAHIAAAAADLGRRKPGWLTEAARAAAAATESDYRAYVE